MSLGAFILKGDMLWAMVPIRILWTLCPDTLSWLILELPHPE